MESKFQGLPISEQAQLILDSGIYVSKSEYKDLEISLYRVEQEFVEIWYDSLLEKVIKIEAVTGNVINPYLKHLAVVYMN
jgi:hypothetical protein